MEDLMKSLPKEAQKAIEEVPALQEIIEPEPQGLVGVVVAGSILKFGCKCRK